VRELVEKVIAASGKTLEVQYDATKPHIKMNITLDTSKAKATFGWEPRVSLEDGLKLTMDWYKKDLL